jgi:hypothetical protein
VQIQNVLGTRAPVAFLVNQQLLRHETGGVGNAYLLGRFKQKTILSGQWTVHEEKLSSFNWPFFRRAAPWATINQILPGLKA